MSEQNDLFKNLQKFAAFNNNVGKADEKTKIPKDGEDDQVDGEEQVNGKNKVEANLVNNAIVTEEVVTTDPGMFDYAGENDIGDGFEFHGGVSNTQSSLLDTISDVAGSVSDAIFSTAEAAGQKVSDAVDTAASLPGRAADAAGEWIDARIEKAKNSNIAMPFSKQEITYNGPTHQGDTEIHAAEGSQVNYADAVDGPNQQANARDQGHNDLEQIDNHQDNYGTVYGEMVNESSNYQVEHGCSKPAPQPSYDPGYNGEGLGDPAPTISTNRLFISSDSAISGGGSYSGEGAGDASSKEVEKPVYKEVEKVINIEKPVYKEVEKVVEIEKPVYKDKEKVIEKDSDSAEVAVTKKKKTNWAAILGGIAGAGLAWYAIDSSRHKGKDGKDGVDGAKGETGATGATGAKGEKGDTGRGITNTEVNDKGDVVVTYSDGKSEVVGNLNSVKDFAFDQATGGLTVNYTNGKSQYLGELPKGLDGANGKSAYEVAKENGFKGTEKEWLKSLEGKDGRGISSTNINDKGELTITYTDGTSENKGVVKGQDGTTITNTQIDNKGHLIVTLSNGEKYDAGKAKGDDGVSGVGIDNLQIDENGHLQVKLSDGTVQDAGKAKGDDGKDGRGISSTNINDKGELTITYTDGTSEN
ncbi:hypothetical protein IJ843_08410, partial [bacterium]|nr:hypothetical protein [bacterium]